MPLHLSETQLLSNVDGVAVQNSGLTKILKVTYNQIRPQVNSRLSLRPRTHVEQTCRTERYQSCADTGGKQTALVLLYTQVVEQTKRLMVYNKRRRFYFIYIFQHRNLLFGAHVAEHCNHNKRSSLTEVLINESDYIINGALLY